MFEEDFCAGCCVCLFNAQEVAESSIYSPKRSFILCMSCYRDEEELIEKHGGNDLPGLLRHYYDNINS